MEKSKFFLLPGLELDRSVVHAVSNRYIVWAIPACCTLVYLQRLQANAVLCA
jgi:hypothetical protein